MIRLLNRLLIPYLEEPSHYHKAVIGDLKRSTHPNLSDFYFSANLTPQVSDDITASILSIINNMLLDLMATLARLDNDKRIERIKQGQLRAIDAGKKIGGSAKNQEIRTKVASYLDKCLTVKEIAKIVGCGVATLYRIKNELKHLI
jgi:hypothetical protein